jgi:ABC-2 type transport system permease protein
MFPALHDTTVPMGQWLNNVIPYMVILLVEVIMLLLAGIHMFSKEDNI